MDAKDESLDYGAPWAWLPQAERLARQAERNSLFSKALEVVLRLPTPAPPA